MAANEAHESKLGSGSRAALTAACLLAIPLCACNQVSGSDGFSEEEWKAIRQIEPLKGAVADKTFNHEADNLELAKLGHALFFETDVAEPSRTDGPRAKLGEAGKFGCVTCHDTKYFTDSLLVNSQGVDHYEPHNAPTMVNVAYWDWYLWVGLFDSMYMHGFFGTGQEASPLAYAHYMYRKYKDEYNAIFPEYPLDPALDDDAPDKDRFPLTGSPGTPAYEAMTTDDKKIIDRIRSNVARAFDAYPRHLVTRNSPFEQYLQGDAAALTPDAKRGLRLFVGKAACNDCHYGPLLSDQKFHNIGIQTPQGKKHDVGRGGIVGLQFSPSGGPGTFNEFNSMGPYSDDPDAGRLRLEALKRQDCKTIDEVTEACTGAKDELVGAFRTASLLNIAETAPYFHTGEARSLEEVVWHYNRGGGVPGTFAGTKSPRLRPLGLTDSEVYDLVAFLRTLTGEFVEPEYALPPANPKKRLEPLPAAK